MTGFSNTVEWSGSILTIGVLKEFVGKASGMSDGTRVSISHVSGDRPFDSGYYCLSFTKDGSWENPTPTL